MDESDASRLFDVTLRMSDGKQVDWKRIAESSEDEAERELLRHLRIIDEISRVHAELRSSAGKETPPEVPTIPDRGDETVSLLAHDAPETTASGRSNLAHHTRWRHLERLEPIGSGGFGQVYRAWETSLQRPVALKLLRVDRETAESQRGMTILDEGRRLARVRHPNVIQVYGAEEFEGRIGLWMELIEGRTLHAIVEEQGPFGDREAAGIVSDVCRALAAVHRQSLIHRDVSARNVMREVGGRIVLMDFGAGTEQRDDGSAITKNPAGTPYYMAPEVLNGREASIQSDLYSAGVLLYYLLSGTHPVEGNSLHELVQAHAAGRIRLIHEIRPELPNAIVQVIGKATHPEPRARYASAAEMETALSVALGGGSTSAPSLPSETAPRKRRRGLLVAATSALLALVALVVVQRIGVWRGGGPAPDHYTVSAALFRNSATGAERLLREDRVSPGDQVFLEFETSDSVFVYVVNKDERGDSFLLFPNEQLSPSNPLLPGRHRLPGTRAGSQFFWQITSAGGTESYWIIASKTRPLDLELELMALPAISWEVASRTNTPGGLVRGTGGLAQSTKPVLTEFQDLMLASKDLGNGPEDVTGLWIRHIHLQNPSTEP